MRAEDDSNRGVRDHAVQTKDIQHLALGGSSGGPQTVKMAPWRRAEKQVRVKGGLKVLQEQPRAVALAGSTDCHRESPEANICHGNRLHWLSNR